MSGENNKAERLDMPRERHYVLAHEALRQVCRHDPVYFFGVMASPDQAAFIADLVEQVETFCPDDETVLEAASIRAHLSRMGNRPFVAIEMPPPAAYVECVYVGVVGMLDVTRPEDFPEPEVGFFTLEVGEKDGGECRFFCKWDGDDHVNLAEMEKTADLGDFTAMIRQHLDGR